MRDRAPPAYASNPPSSDPERHGTPRSRHGGRTGRHPSGKYFPSTRRIADSHRRQRRPLPEAQTEVRDDVPDVGIVEPAGWHAEVGNPGSDHPPQIVVGYRCTEAAAGEIHGNDGVAPWPMTDGAVLYVQLRSSEQVGFCRLADVPRLLHLNRGGQSDGRQRKENKACRAQRSSRYSHGVLHGNTISGSPVPHGTNGQR